MVIALKVFLVGACCFLGLLYCIAIIECFLGRDLLIPLLKKLRITW